MVAHKKPLKNVTPTKTEPLVNVAITVGETDKLASMDWMVLT